MSPVFCRNSLLNFCDPWGWVDWQDETVRQLRDGYMQTAHGAQKIAMIEELEKSTKITITVGKGTKDSFDRKSHVSLTGKGVTYRSGDVMDAKGSPLEVLNHELDHAQRFLEKGYQGYIDALGESHDLLENMIEALAIEDTNKLRKELGNDKPRTHYWKEKKERLKDGRRTGIFVRVDNFGVGDYYNDFCN